MSFTPKEIAVHPVVLLSVVDHYSRSGIESTKRVIGVLLGDVTDGKINVTNCYALPFEEDQRDKKVWFIDHIFNESMYEMHQQINYKEVIVGWYSSGPKIRPHDIEINEVFRKFTPNPILVIIDVQDKESLGMPSESYFTKEEIDCDGQLIKTFEKLQTVIEASLPEEIGVEFLLRDISDSSKSSMNILLSDKETSIKALISRLNEIKTYLSNVVSKRVSLNPQIIYNVQEIFNFLPNFETEDIIKSLSSQINNNYIMIYLGWLVRTTISLHKLINNKIMIKEEEKNAEKLKEDKKKEETKEGEKPKDDKKKEEKK